MDHEWGRGTRNMDVTHALRGTAARVVLLRAANTMLEIFEYASPTPRHPLGFSTQGSAKSPPCPRHCSRVTYRAVRAGVIYGRELPQAAEGWLSL